MILSIFGGEEPSFKRAKLVVFPFISVRADRVRDRGRTPLRMTKNWHFFLLYYNQDIECVWALYCRRKDAFLVVLAPHWEHSLILIFQTILLGTVWYERHIFLCRLFPGMCCLLQTLEVQPLLADHILPPGLSLVPLEQWLLRFLFRMALQGPVSPDQSPAPALWWWLFGNEASSSAFIEFFSWHDQNKSPPPAQ